MSIATLEYIKNLMQRIGIPYEFMRWNLEPPDEYYFTGEYNEHEMTTREECGRQDATFILRGYTWGSWLLLEQAKAKIERSLPLTAILDDGSGVAIFYSSGTVVPTGDADFKSIKIDLTIQEWRVR